MKGVVIIFALAIVAIHALTDEQKQKIKTYSEDCSKSSGVDKEMITNARKGLFTDNDKFKEYLLCMSKKIGFQNEHGGIEVNVLKEKAGAEFKDSKVVEDLVTKCAVQKKTPQETAYETVKCYYENTPTHISIA